jgi:hypothetical protein
MLIRGYTTKENSWHIEQNGEKKNLIRRYQYNHIYFIFRWVKKVQWFLVGDNRNEDREITKEEAKKLLPNENLSINLYDRFSWILFPALIAFGFYLMATLPHAHK